MLQILSQGQYTNGHTHLDWCDMYALRPRIWNRKPPCNETVELTTRLHIVARSVSLQLKEVLYEASTSPVKHFKSIAGHV